MSPKQGNLRPPAESTQRWICRGSRRDPLLTVVRRGDWDMVGTGTRPPELVGTGCFGRMRDTCPSEPDVRLRSVGGATGFNGPGSARASTSTATRSTDGASGASLWPSCSSAPGWRSLHTGRQRVIVRWRSGERSPGPGCSSGSASRSTPCALGCEASHSGRTVARTDASRSGGSRRASNRPSTAEPVIRAATTDG